MHIDTTASTEALCLANEAEAAQRAITVKTMEESTKHIAALCVDTDEGHIAEHIRGMVAATMGNLSAQASVATLDNAADWQRWALGMADGLEQRVVG